MLREKSYELGELWGLIGSVSKINAEAARYMDWPDCCYEGAGTGSELAGAKRGGRSIKMCHQGEHQ